MMTPLGLLAPSASPLLLCYLNRYVSISFSVSVFFILSTSFTVSFSLSFLRTWLVLRTRTHTAPGYFWPLRAHESPSRKWRSESIPLVFTLRGCLFSRGALCLQDTGGTSCCSGSTHTLQSMSISRSSPATRQPKQCALTGTWTWRRIFFFFSPSHLLEGRWSCFSSTRTQRSWFYRWYAIRATRIGKLCIDVGLLS